MSKSDFNNIIESEIKNLEIKFSENSDNLIYDKNDYKKIISKIQQANDLSQNELYNIFLNKLKLPIGEMEKRSIWARNPMIHDIFKTKNPWEPFELSRSYKTYFNRAFLKVLGYNGKYIDYTKYTHLGYTKKDIDEIPG